MRRNEDGAAAVELAAALPLLLLVIFGIIQLILLLTAKTVLDHAAYEAARTAMVVDDLSRAKQRARRVVRALPYGTGFLGGKTDVKLTQKGGSVTATVDVKIRLLPFIRQVSLAARGDGNIGLTGRARRRIEPYLGY